MSGDSFILLPLDKLSVAKTDRDELTAVAIASWHTEYYARLVMVLLTISVIWTSQAKLVYHEAGLCQKIFCQ